VLVGELRRDVPGGDAGPPLVGHPRRPAPEHQPRRLTTRRGPGAQARGEAVAHGDW
jgi:hypothetical protein